jgi:hypothetical protein
VRLEIAFEEGRVQGSVAIDLPAAAGSGCPALRKRYAIVEATQGPGTLAFTDSGSNEWTLAVRRGGEVLQGLVAWQQGGVEQPLADGFSGPGGERPGSRLRGEVRVRRAGTPESAAEGPAAGGSAPAADAAGASAPAPAKSGGGGRHVKNVAAVLAANVVGLGLLYGVNVLGQGSSESGVVTCSPRVCIVGAPNEPCYCEGNVLSGASCGSTPSGAPLGAFCDGHAIPCQSGLSCNSGVCEDSFGRCPY